MSPTKEFFENWLRENVGNLPAESGVSIAALARQFEQQAVRVYVHELNRYTRGRGRTFSTSCRSAEAFAQEFNGHEMPGAMALPRLFASPARLVRRQPNPQRALHTQLRWSA